MSEADEATEEETTVGAVPSEDAEEEFSPFDETSESFSPSVIRKAKGPDGLPTQIPPPGSGMSDIPPLSTDTLVCMGDFSSFAIRDAFGVVLRRFETAVQDSEGSWWAAVRDSECVELFGRMKITLGEKGSFQHREVKSYLGTYFVQVEPHRPPCKHYVRQVTQLDKNPEHKDHLRLCAARRTTEGTFMTLKDVGMWACSMREPRHPESEKLIQEFDLLKMQQGERRELYSIKGNE